MYGKDDILRFAFDTFDKDGSGTIDEKEFMDMAYMINNANPTFPVRVVVAAGWLDCCR